jgi:glycosyltransferase involved in cell wall biosynthesis
MLNDYSGSPKVLKKVLAGLLERGLQIDLITSRGGVLDELKTKKNIRFFYFSYKFSENQIVALLRYTFVQSYTFFFSFKYLFQKNTVFYINTILPVGAAFAGRIIGKKVVYHYHENAFIKSTFYRILCKIMQCIASEIICVSEYQRSFLSRKKDVIVIPNTLPEDFCSKFNPTPQKAFEKKTILMLSSLKLYKGTLEFIELARRLPLYKFELVINDTLENIKEFLKDKQIEKINNLMIYERQNDVIPFYKRATIVLNLSDKKKFLETFGLTVLEAMAVGLPTIVPTEGGVAKMVEDGVNGYKIDVIDLDKIENHINLILSNFNLYKKLSENALKIAKNYNNASTVDKILKIIETN